MKVSKEQFDIWVEEAINLVPKKLLRKMHKLVFIVDDRPTRALIKESELRRGYTLFGYYQGYEQTGRKNEFIRPDRISIFRKAICEYYKTKKTIRDQVYRTVWHEIAHHFGSDEDGALRAEKRMFETFIRSVRFARTHKREMKKHNQVKKGRRGYKRKSKITFRVKTYSTTTD